jgi:hypothetical protein
MHHRWVKLTQTDVALLPDPDNDNEVFAIEDRESERETYGCKVCGVPLEGNTDSLCKGADDGED